MVTARVEYNVNPRFVPDDIRIWLGNSKDSAVIYDSIAKEWTVQTTNAAGALQDRIRVKGEQDAGQLAFVSMFAEWDEIADPAAPSANKARLYSRDNGAGKTQLVVRFPTGAIQVLATEP